MKNFDIMEVYQFLGGGGGSKKQYIGEIPKKEA